MDELVKDGYNGFLFSDIGEVPELVARIMQDYKRFSYNAWKHSQNFTYEKFKGRYLRILKEYVRKERMPIATTARKKDINVPLILYA